MTTLNNFGIESKAILVHHHPKNNSIDVICHDVIQTESKEYILGAGRVFGLSDQLSLISIINQAHAPKLQLLPANVLAQHGDLLVWWIPSKVNDLVIASGDGYERLEVRYPSLIFFAKGSALSVAAISGNQRPTKDTVLFHAPVMCQDNQFKICKGNMTLPSRPNVENIGEYESFFFDGANTHLNANTIKGISSDEDFHKFYKELGVAPFPKSKLVKTRFSLSDFMAVCAGVENDD